MTKHNVICDRTGFKVPAERTVMEWTGLRVLREHADMRHPQEFVRSRQDEQSVPDPRPEASDMFVSQGDFNLDFNDDFLIHVPVTL